MSSFKNVIMKNFLLICFAAFSPFIVSATNEENQSPQLYLIGTMNDFTISDEWKFEKSEENLYYLNNISLSSNDKWTIKSADNADYNFGCTEPVQIKKIMDLTNDGESASLSEDYNGPVYFNLENEKVIFGNEPAQWDFGAADVSGTLPVLYINIYHTDSEGNFSSLDDEILSKDLPDKNYRSGEYWLDTSNCDWAQAEGFENIGSKKKPLPLEMKARGNFTRTWFSKKPFKLKLGKKQNLLNISANKSKHYALLAHADDNLGYLRNYVSFNIGERIGLPWTPKMQPVELVLNGDYRGIYFLTESVRVEPGRLEIEELDDNITDPMLASGGYLVEIDNYNSDNQIKMKEVSCIPDHNPLTLRITWDTPEEYSDIQKRFITDQFTTMNNLMGTCDQSDELWSYMDLDDAVRYYLVQEITSHIECYQGSTYLFRDRGEGKKWHFSPLWDSGNAFSDRVVNDFMYNNTVFGNLWIPSIACNQKFQDKVRQTWKWFMSNKFEGLIDDINLYTDRIKTAAVSDRKRWKDMPVPNAKETVEVIDNSNIESRRDLLIRHMNRKIEWLKGQWGDFNGSFSEPEADTTEAAALPYYVNPPSSGHVTDIYFSDNTDEPWTDVYAYIIDETDDSVYEPLGEFPGSKLYKEKYNSTEAHAIHFYAFPTLSPNAKIIFNNSVEKTPASEVIHGNLYTRHGDAITGIDDIFNFAEEESSVEYYDLQGHRLSEPLKKGVTIVRRGSSVSKLIF